MVLFAMLTSVIVDNLNVACVGIGPVETDPPLVVNPYAVLPLPAAAQRFQSITRNRRHVREFSGRVELVQFPFGHAESRFQHTTAMR